MLKYGAVSIVCLAVLTLCYSRSDNRDFASNSGNLTTPLPVNRYASNQEWQEKQAVWQSKGINSYVMEMKHNSSGFTPSARTVVVTVENGATVSIQRLEKNDNGRLAPYEMVDTVPKLFNLIAKAIAEGSDVNVEYDAEFSFPKHISIKSKASNGWGDYSILRFEKK
jgi:hypothetical protein